MELSVSSLDSEMLVFSSQPQPDYKGLIIKGISEEELETKVLDINLHSSSS